MPQKAIKPTDPRDAIAMPPLAMTLVHAQNQRENNVTLVSTLRQTVEIPRPADVDPQSIKKIIEHLNKKD